MLGNLTKQDLLNSFNAKRQAVIVEGKKAEVLNKGILCDFCMDKHYVPVLYQWIVLHEIPEDFDPADLLVRNNPDVIMVPCSCHSGHVNDGPEKKDEQPTRKVTRFDEIFDVWGVDSHFAKTLKAYRERVAAERWKEQEDRLYEPQVEIGELVAGAVRNAGLWD